LLCWTSTATGDTVEIRYTITSGSASTPDGNFPITSGSYSVTYQAAISGTVPLDGPAVLNTFAFNASGFTYGADLSQVIFATLAGPVNGAGVAFGTQFQNTLDPIQLLGTVTGHCFYTGYCGLYGFVTSVAKQFPSFTFYAGVSALNISRSSGSVSGRYSIPAFTTGTAIVSFTGQEIQRIPHPLDRVTITVGPDSDQNPVASGGVAVASVSASDTFAHALDYQWSAVCSGLASDGVFATPMAAVTDWTAPANATGMDQDCTISVLVTDGAFGNNDNGQFTQTVPEPSALGLGLAALFTLVGMRRRSTRRL
jgi:MYXO-CTERM domain-containing protein